MTKKILIIDDDLYIRDLYKEIMEDAGHSVEIAADGVEGLTRLNNSQYDLVMLDVMMPKLDGLGVLKKLKENPPNQLPGAIVLLTNLGHDPIIKEAMSLGAASYLIKADLTPDALLEKLQPYLK